MSLPYSDHPLIPLARQHLGDILHHAIAHQAPEQALIVADFQCELAGILAHAYRQALPAARFIDFEAVPASEVMAALSQLQERDLVILVQSTHFRLDAYRLRVELFKRGLKVIEHPHLSRMSGAEVAIYVDALAYDTHYYRETGQQLKHLLDQAKGAVLDSDGALLHFEAGFEPAKLNVGDYSDMANVGGQFPIGEVFTESRDLEAVHGDVRVFVFGDTQFRSNRPAQPITLHVEAGRVREVSHSTPEFDQVLALIRQDEGEVWVRELGLGLNRAFSPERMVRDIGTYERICGVHLSLGAKHGVYSKPQIRRATAKYHIDVFPVTHGLSIDNQAVFQHGRWMLDPTVSTQSTAEQ